MNEIKEHQINNEINLRMLKTRNHRNHTINKKAKEYLHPISKSITARTNSSQIRILLRTANKNIYNLVLQKTKRIEFLPCGLGGNYCSINFEESGDPLAARKFEITWRCVTLGVFAFEWFVSSLDLVIT